MTIVNSAGETPKDVARRFGRLACVSVLGGDSGTKYHHHIASKIQHFKLEYMGHYRNYYIAYFSMLCLKCSMHERSVYPN